MTQNLSTPPQPNHRLAEQVQHFWERSWSHDSYHPTWVVSAIPQELRRAVETAWFPAGCSILDIGCGSGELSGWLAAQKFTVHGVDCAQAAIDRARVQYRDMAHPPTFQVIDICRDAATTPQFDALFDRACLHGLPKALHADYVVTVASWALPGATFLLLYGLHRDVERSAQEVAEERQALQSHLEQLFASHFQLMQIEPAVIERSHPHEPVPGLAVWMRRL